MIRSGCAAWVFVLLAIIICLSAVGCSEEHVHTEAVDAAVAATCTEAGKTEGKHCSVCNAVLIPQTEVKALGHTEAVDAAIAATCTEAGKTEGKHCSVCNAVLIPQTEVKALGHTEAVDAAIAATCTEAGKTEGKHCSVCNAVLIPQTEVAALGHTEAVDAAVAATCTESGKTEGKHCSVCNAVLIPQTEVAALGHTEVVDAAVAATCTEAGKTEGKHCSVCGEILVAQTEVAKLAHTEAVDVAVAPTTSKTGLTEGKHCSVCNTVLVEQQIVEKVKLAELCKLHDTRGDHDCILDGGYLASWNNYGVFKDPVYRQNMNYRVFLPRNYDPSKEYPMVIYMHGLGFESKHINEIGINTLLTQAISQTKMEVICVIPQCLPSRYWPVHPYTTEIAFNLFEELQRHLSVDKTRIYVSGHSYGSMGTLLLLENHPNYFAGAMIAAGAATSYTNYKNIATTPLRMFCGELDSGFAAKLNNLYVRLKALNADVEYKIWPGADHGTFSYSAKNSEVTKWLLEQDLDNRSTPSVSEEIIPQSPKTPIKLDIPAEPKAVSTTVVYYSIKNTNPHGTCYDSNDGKSAATAKGSLGTIGGTGAIEMLKNGGCLVVPGKMWVGIADFTLEAPSSPIVITGKDPINGKNYLGTIELANGENGTQTGMFMIKDDSTANFAGDYIFENTVILHRKPSYSMTLNVKNGARVVISSSVKIERMKNAVTAPSDTAKINVEEGGYLYLHTVGFSAYSGKGIIVLDRALYDSGAATAKTFAGFEGTVVDENGNVLLVGKGN